VELGKCGAVPGADEHGEWQHIWGVVSMENFMPPKFRKRGFDPSPMF